MLLNPEAEKKVVEEIQAIVPGDAIPTEEDIKKMKYVDNVLKETLRLYPSVPFTTRTAIKDDILPGGIKVEAGTSVAYSQFYLHRNPKYWDNPEKFTPERWDNIEMKHPFQYTPFHAGPMQCLGRHMAHIEAKILFTNVFKRFKFTLHPNQEIIPTMGITLFLYPGLKVKVEER